MSAGLAAAILFGGCAAADRSGGPSADDPPGNVGRPPPTVVDSAGVRIVVNGGDDVSVGVLRRERVLDSSEPFYRVRGGATLSDGSTVVADGGSKELWWFSREGRQVASSGGPGDGPGEFRGLYDIVAKEDAIWAIDSRIQRLTEFSTKGDVRRTLDGELGLDDPAGRADVRLPSSIVDVLSGDRILGFPSPNLILAGVRGPLPVFTVLGVFPPSQDERETITRVRIMDFYETPGPDADFYFEGVPGSGMIRAHARRGRAAVTEGTFHDILVLDEGVLTMRIREERSRLPYEVPDSATSLVPPADSLPAYDEITVDSEGRIWARVGAAPKRPVSHWRLFDVDGALLGSLELGGRDRVLDAVGQRLLLLRYGELDVETVEFWRIEADGAGG